FTITPLMRKANTDARDINGLLSMFYSIEKCNQLKQEYEKDNNFVYDFVVRIRTDLLFMSPFYIKKNIDTNKLYVPYGYDYSGLNDQVAYGGSPIMDQYSMVFSKIEQLLQEGVKLNPEFLLKRHVDKNNLPLE